jgi:hypothetical protein
MKRELILNKERETGRKKSTWREGRTRGKKYRKKAGRIGMKKATERIVDGWKERHKVRERKRKHIRKKVRNNELMGQS